jgi:hypothetical protein
MSPNSHEFGYVISNPRQSVSSVVEFRFSDRKESLP